MGDKGDFEGLNPGCGVSWTCEPAGVAGRVARIAFASAHTGVRRAEVSLEEPARLWRTKTTTGRREPQVEFRRAVQFHRARREGDERDRG